MTAADLRALLVKLDLSQERAAHLLGVGKRTVERYCSKDGRPPRWVALALRQAVADEKVGRR